MYQIQSHINLYPSKYLSEVSNFFACLDQQKALKGSSAAEVKEQPESLPSSSHTSRMISFPGFKPLLENSVPSVSSIQLTKQPEFQVLLRILCF